MANDKPFDRFFVYLPLDPVAKARPRLGRNGRTYTPAKTVAFEKAIKQHFKAERKGKPPMAGPLSACISFVISRPKSVSANKRKYPVVKPDLDNLAKAVLDAANGILWEDDSQICKLVLTKDYSLANSPGSIIVDVCCDVG